MTLILKMLFIPLTVVSAMQLKTCSGARESLPADEYISWVENKENGLLVEKQVGYYKLQLQYKPQEYAVLMDERKATLTAQEMSVKKEAFAELDYFTLRIGAEDGKDITKFNITDEQEYYARLQYFAMEMGNDLQLISGKDTLPCAMFHYERTYGIDPRAAFVLAFPKKKNGTAVTGKTLLFNDRHLGTGPVMLTITSESLNNVPALTLN